MNPDFSILVLLDLPIGIPIGFAIGTLLIHALERSISRYRQIENSPPSTPTKDAKPKRKRKRKGVASDIHGQIVTATALGSVLFCSGLMWVLLQGGLVGYVLISAGLITVMTGDGSTDG